MNDDGVVEIKQTQFLNPNIDNNVLKTKNSYVNVLKPKNSYVNVLDNIEQEEADNLLSEAAKEEDTRIKTSYTVLTNNTLISKGSLVLTHNIKVGQPTSIDYLQPEKVLVDPNDALKTAYSNFVIDPVKQNVILSRPINYDP